MQAIVAPGSLLAPLFLLHVLTTGLALWLLRFARRHRTSPVGQWFVHWLVAVCVWIGTHTIGLVVVNPTLRTASNSVELAAVTASAGCWLLFTLAYAGHWDGSGRRVSAAVGIPTALVVAVVLANPAHGLLSQVTAVEVEGGVAVASDGASAELVLTLLAYVFGLYGWGLLLLEELVRSTNRLYRDQTVALLAAVAVPLVTAVLTMAGLSPLVVDATPLSFTVSALPLTYAVFRTEAHRLLPASYRIGEQTLLEAVDHGLLVLDDDDRVVFANAVGSSIFGLDDQWMLGRDVERVLDASELEPAVSWLDAGRSAEEDEHADRGEPAPAGETDVPQTLRDDAGRTYGVTASRTFVEADDAVYRTLVVEDVTEERRRRQRLLVLNRIVRHNLRNDLTALRGHAERLAEQVDDDAVAVVDDIAGDLTRLGEKAHEMDQVMREANTGAEVINVASVVERVAEEVEAQTGTTIEVWGDVQAWTRTHPELVEAIVSNLVELSVRRHAERIGLPGHDDDDAESREDDDAGSREDGDEGSREDDDAGSRENGDEGSREDGRDRGGVATRANGGTIRDTRLPESPTIVVTVSSDPDAVRLSVEDDGPGIPQEEVRTLLDHEGAPLPHGASIELWVVKWCVDIADADWEIETEGWTRVTVAFPSEAALQGTATGLG